jgi:hypothetical protein
MPIKSLTIMKSLSYSAAVLGFLGLLTGYQCALKSEKENMERIEPRRYDTELRDSALENEARMLYGQGERLAARGRELSMIAEEAPHEQKPGRWADAAGALEAALQKYTKVARAFPGSAYADSAQSAIDTLPMDAILFSKGEYNQKVRVFDTIDVGNSTILIRSVNREHDALVEFGRFDEDGNEEDLNPLNPLSTSRVINLTADDYTAGELTKN